MRKFLTIIMLMVAATTMATVKMNSIPTQVVQADGSVLTVIGYGDEHCHYFTTLDGVLLCHRGNDFLIAQVGEDGRLLPTTQLAHEQALRSAQEQLLANRQQRHRFYQSLRQTQRKAPTVQDFNPNYPILPSTGTQKILVILAEFADVKFIDENPIPVFEQYFNYDKIDNEIGNGTARRNFGSVGKYYRDMSFGQFNPQFDVTVKVTLDHPMAYYGEDSENRVDSAFRFRFLPEVCQKAVAQGIDFAPYDADGDNYIDLVYIIYAGYAQSWAGNPTDCIWPKTGIYECGPFSGKNIRLYSVNSELNAYPGAFSDGKRINGVGLACHEFGHCLGLPDIYPTNIEARNAGNHAMEYWDIMDGGEYVQNGYYPTELTAWEREALGWMQIETLRKSGHYELPPLSEDEQKAFRIFNDDDPTHNEYLLLQTIKDTLWNRRQQGHGLLVMHVDFDSEAFSLESDASKGINGNRVNNEIGHSRFTFIPADGEYISQYLVDEETITTAYYRENHWGDPFPGTSEVTSIGNFEMYTGTMEKHITNITENEDGTIAFDFTTPALPTGIVQAHTTDSQAACFSPTGIQRPSGYQLPSGLYLMPQNGSYRKILVR